MPNYAPADWWLNVRAEKRRSEKIVIGWGGSVSHYDSWWFSGIIPAIEEICKADSRVCIKICGNDSRVLDALNIPADQKIHQAGVAPKDWCKVVGTFDIGVAPLDMRDGKKSYDNHRSWIKVLEYLLACVPWVATESDVYAELAAHGTVVQNSPETWAMELKRLIQNIDQAKRFARRQRHIGWNLTIEQNIEGIIQAYANIKQLTVRDLPEVWAINYGVDAAVLRERRTATEAALRQAVEKISETTSPPTQSTVYPVVTGWGGSLRHRGRAVGQPMIYELLSRINRGMIK